jgi:hypothetical protein
MSRATVFDDHPRPVALLIPRRLSSAAICLADGKCDNSVRIGFMRAASSLAYRLLASLPAVQPPSLVPRALAAFRPSLVRTEISARSFWSAPCLCALNAPDSIIEARTSRQRPLPQHTISLPNRDQESKVRLSE